MIPRFLTNEISSPKIRDPSKHTGLESPPQLVCTIIQPERPDSVLHFMSHLSLIERTYISLSEIILVMPVRGKQLRRPLLEKLCRGDTLSIVPYTFRRSMDWRPVLTISTSVLLRDLRLEAMVAEVAFGREPVLRDGLGGWDMSVKCGGAEFKCL